MLHPVVQKTWALAGQTPILPQRMRHCQHLSGIGALTLSPVAKRLNWYMHLHHQSITEGHVMAFLSDLQRHLRGDIVLLWDNLGAHHSAAMRKYLANHPRLIPEYLPPYAPELNAIEYAWSYIKTNPLANLCPDDTRELEQHVTDAFCQHRTEQSLLRGFVRATKLPIQLE